MVYGVGCSYTDRAEGRSVMVNVPEVMTPAEVAALFNVNAKTVSRWERAGKLTSFRTLGGHRRFLTADVTAAMAKVNEKP